MCVTYHLMLTSMHIETLGDLNPLRYISVCGFDSHADSDFSLWKNWLLLSKIFNKCTGYKK